MLEPFLWIYFGGTVVTGVVIAAVLKDSRALAKDWPVLMLALAWPGIILFLLLTMFIRRS